MQNKVVLKIITAGDGGVGKTTLLHRFVNGKFLSDTLMTLGVEFHQKIITIGDSTECKLVLWDLSGQEQFRIFFDRFMDGANGAILMFDLSRFGTLESIDDWVEIVQTYDPKIPIILIGGKSDLEEDSTYDEEKTMEYVEKFNFHHFIKVSSLTGENVEKAFHLLSEEILKVKKIDI